MVFLSDYVRRRLSRFARLRRMLQKWTQLPRGARSLTSRALVVFMTVEMIVRWVRLPRIARTLGVKLEVGAPTADGPPTGALGPDGVHEDRATAHPPTLMAMRDAAASVARHWPFGSGPCLRESLVLGYLVRHHDPILRLGVRKHGDEVQAHAWIEVDGRPLNDPLGFVPFEGHDR